MKLGSFNVTKVSASDANQLHSVGQTARWTAAARARESARHDRLFDDPFADFLSGDEGKRLLTYFHTQHAADTGNPVLPIRTRWFDDFLDTAGLASQVVALGAGLDARAYRLEWRPAAVLFDVDQPALLQEKTTRLAAIGVRPRCDHRIVGVDFAGDWSSDLLAAGLDPARPIVWLCEGLLFYLPEEVATEVVRRAAELSPGGSRFAADLIGTGIFRFPYMREFLRRLAAAGSPWVFGTDDPAGFLTVCGWNPDTVTEPGQPGANYGRWPSKGTPSDFPDLPRSYLVTASV
jgi:methyltransferase (TIGR00027 family)